jgi:hypothetical protein
LVGANVVGANVDVGTINAWSPDLTVGGVVKIDAGQGTVTDANKDNAADIFAKAISFNGYGPATTSPGTVLEVVTELVQVTVPQGLVVRETGANGRTAFNAMNAGTLHRQMVVEGTNVSRVTQDPAALLDPKVLDAQRISAGIPSYSTLLKNPGPAPVAYTPLVPAATVSTLAAQPTLSTTAEAALAVRCTLASWRKYGGAFTAEPSQVRTRIPACLHACMRVCCLRSSHLGWDALCPPGCVLF